LQSVFVDDVQSLEVFCVLTLRRWIFKEVMSIQNAMSKWSNHHRAASAERVVAAVRHMLADGLVKPGERLPAEHELVRELDVTRTGVRTGLHLLKAMGVVEMRSGLGSYIAPSPPNLELEPLSLLAALQSFTSAETLVARRLLEVGLAGLAAKNATENDLASLAEEVTDMYASLDNRSQYLLHDIRFHRALATAAGNPVLATLTDMVSAVLYDVRRYTVDHIRDLRPSVEMHRKIYGAVRAGDADEARAAMSEHLLRTEQEICNQNQV
jgi:GntR family transcriptional regulator, transcriptional repressor for pyruvate dehydrogenase complex